MWAHNRWCKYIFIWVCRSTGPWVWCLSFSRFVFVLFVISNQSTSKRHIYWTSVNLMSCCIKHTSKTFWFQGTKARHVEIHNINKSNSTSVVEQSSIQPNKLDNRKSSVGGGWRRQVRVRQNRGVSFKKRGLGNDYWRLTWFLLNVTISRAYLLVLHILHTCVT